MIARADLIQVFIIAAFGFKRLADSHINVRALAGNGRKNRAGISVETFLTAIVTNFLDNSANKFIKVDVGVCGNFAQQNHDPRFGGRLTGNARHRVLLETGIEHGVADLVAQFIGMSLCY